MPVASWPNACATFAPAGKRIPRIDLTGGNGKTRPAKIPEEHKGKQAAGDHGQPGNKPDLFLMFGRNQLSFDGDVV